jgi:serine/threonine-protein kinase
MALQVGVDSVVAGFRVKSLLGRGATGSVYLAEDTSTSDLVALKVLAPTLAQDERFRQRFLRESHLAANLDSPHAVRTFEAGEADGVLYLAMAYVRGPDLRRLLQDEGRLEPARAVALVAQVAEALDAAHSVGLVHRDVKPGNILIEQQADGEHAFVCDFGLARHVSSVSSLTGERGFVGTIDYVPPEQIEGGTIDGRTDVYSLGCVLYECLAGRRPFERESELSVVFAHLHDQPPAITAIQPGLPAPFGDVFGTALAKSPEDRYATCGELAEAAAAALQGKVLARRRLGRRRLVLTAVAIVAAVAAPTGAVLATRGGPDISRPSAISQTSIDGAQLGLRQGAYQALFGGSGILVNQARPGQEGKGSQGGKTPGSAYPTLAFNAQKVWVFFPRGIKGRAEIVTTWNKDFKTDRGIGPCSTIPQLLKAYGNRVKPDYYGTVGNAVFMYQVGKNLLFSASGRHPSSFVTAVGLFNGSAKGADDPGGALPWAGFVTGWETPTCVP